MPNTREKLIELLNAVDGVCPKDASCYDCEYKDVVHCAIPAKADYLIANGVTVQKWIPVTERLPEKDKAVLCLLGNEDYWVAVWDHCDDGLWTDGEWWRAKNFVTHWMPLPEPPKGE